MAAPEPLSIRTRLSRGVPTIGLAAYVVRTPEIVPIARSCGFDWLLVDTEHTALGLSDVASILVAAAETSFPALVRSRGVDDPDLARFLDLGAAGIVVPHVDTLAEAERVVARCRFGPLGRRSIPGPQPRFGFCPVPVGAMAEAVESETAIVLMVESASGLAAAPAMAALPGVDCLMVGANDLADGLGRRGEVGHPDVLAAFRHVATACREAGIAFGTIGVPDALLGSYAVDLGAALVVATNDINLLMDAGSALASRLRGR